MSPTGSRCLHGLSVSVVVRYLRIHFQKYLKSCFLFGAGYCAEDTGPLESAVLFVIRWLSHQNSKTIR